MRLVDRASEQRLNALRAGEEQSLAERGYALAAVPLFAGLPPLAIAKLEAFAHRCAYRRGHIVFSKGDPGNTLLFLPSLPLGAGSSSRLPI